MCLWVQIRREFSLGRMEFSLKTENRLELSKVIRPKTEPQVHPAGTESKY